MALMGIMWEGLFPPAARVPPLDMFFRETTRQQLVAFCILVGVTLIVFFSLDRLRRWMLQRRIEREFFQAVDRLKLTPEEEELVAGLSNRYEVERPVYLLRIIRIFDFYAAREAQRLLTAEDLAFGERAGGLDRLYRLRRKLFFVEKGGLLIYKVG